MEWDPLTLDQSNWERPNLTRFFIIYFDFIFLYILYYIILSYYFACLVSVKYDEQKRSQGKCGRHTIMFKKDHTNMVKCALVL